MANQMEKYGVLLIRTRLASMAKRNCITFRSKEGYITSNEITTLFKPNPGPMRGRSGVLRDKTFRACGNMAQAIVAANDTFITAAIT
jgi:hypothetical protein